MIRMKNRINQVVVGKDMSNPIECEITNIFRKGKEEQGKVLLNGKKQRVHHIGGGVWELASDTNQIQLQEAV